MATTLVGMKLVVDFDGTCCLGDGPVRAYASAAFAMLDSEKRQAATELFEGYLAGDLDDATYADAYELVAAACAPSLGRARLQDAYMHSRSLLGDDTVDIRPAPGLERLRDIDAKLVLATNSPSLGMDAALARLGLSHFFDEVITSAHKPGGWPKLIGATEPSHVMSVGDHYDNDIKRPFDMGCATAYVTDRTITRPAHVSAPTLDEITDDIAAWSRDPVGWLSSHAPASG